MKLILKIFLILNYFFFINAIKKPSFYVLKTEFSTTAFGFNGGKVSVSTKNGYTTISSSLGSMMINNELAEAKNGYVVEGNTESNDDCKSGPLQSIITKCEGKLILRNRNENDVKFL